MFLRSTLGAFATAPKPLFYLFDYNQRFNLYKQRPKLYPSIQALHDSKKQSFQINLDVRNFNQDEIRVEAQKDYVLIEGKQEKTTDEGHITMHFVNKFKLPEGCSPKDVQYSLNNGILTVKVDRYLDTAPPAGKWNIWSQGDDKKKLE